MVSARAKVFSTSTVVWSLGAMDSHSKIVVMEIWF